MTENLVITIARNNLQLSKNAIRSFFKQDIGNVRVLVLDNASTDGTRGWLSARLEYNADLLAMRFPQQLSVAACWNRGLTWAFKNKVDYALVCNNDVVLRPDCMRLLVEHGGLFVTGVGVNTKEQTEECDPKLERPHPDFSCYLIRRETWERVGPFDENYLIAFGEDCSAHVRMHRMGIRACCIGVPFHHIGSATIKNADPDEQKRIMDQAEKNREYFYQQFGARIGTPGYEALFEEKWFGVDARQETMVS